VYLGMIVLFFKFSSPIQLLERVSQAGLGIVSGSSVFNVNLSLFLPNNLAANVLCNISRDQGHLALMQGALLLLTTFVVFVFVLYVASRFYYRSWLVTFEFQARSNTVESGKRVKLFDFRKKSILSPQMESLLKKEYFQFIREASQWIHFALMVVLVAVFAISVRNIDLRVRTTDIHTMGYLVLYAFGGFLSCSLALRFVFPAISMEGKSFWSQLSAPLDLRKAYFTKFALGFLLVVLPALLVAVFSNIPFVRMSERRPLLMYFGLFSTFWVTLTLVSLNLGLGGYFANYQEKSPIRVASSQGATLTFLVSLVYLISMASIIILPLREYFQSLFQFLPFDMTMIVAPGTTLGVLSAGLSAFALVVGLRSLQRDF
jgi:ABC-2 type transport system permease protein